MPFHVYRTKSGKVIVKSPSGTRTFDNMEKARNWMAHAARAAGDKGKRK